MADMIVPAGIRAAAGVVLALALLLAGLAVGWLLQGESDRSPADRPPGGMGRGLLLAVWTAAAVATFFLVPGAAHPGEVPPDPVRQGASYVGYLSFYAAGLLLLAPRLSRRWRR